METAQDYRRYAVECFELAAMARNPQNKSSLLAMAHAWLSLAALADKKEATALTVLFRGEGAAPRASAEAQRHA